MDILGENWNRVTREELSWVLTGEQDVSSEEEGPRYRESRRKRGPNSLREEGSSVWLNMTLGVE